LSVGIGQSVSDQDGFERNRDRRGSGLLLVELVDDGGDVGQVGTSVGLSRDMEGNLLELGELFVEKL